jgi:hypothetical protein
MIRLLRIVSVTAIVVALPLGAAADAPVCVEMTADARAGWVSMTLDVGMSGISLADEPPAVVLPGRDTTGDLPALWCSSPDDPRCSPVRHDGEGPLWSFSQAPKGSRTTLSWPSPRASGTSLASWPVDPLLGTAVSRRIERPPRT